MNQFLGQFKPTINIRCDKCGKIIGPSSELKVAYRQQGIAQGSFCNRTHALEAYDQMVTANPELLKD
jgi:hypothetical protein